jgi:hypothetical protein
MDSSMTHMIAHDAARAVSTVASRNGNSKVQDHRKHKENGMITLDSCSTQDVDRLLGLADQFLDDWAQDAVQEGKSDEDYEQRSAEWKLIRPLLVSAPAMLQGLMEIAHICQGSSDPVAISCGAFARTALNGFLSAEGA